MYYNLRYIIAGVVIVFVLAYVINGMRIKKTADTFYCAMFNGIYLNPDNMDDFKSSLWDFMVKDDGYLGSSNMDRTYFESFTDSYEDNIMIDGNYDKRKIDVVISNEDTFNTYAKNGQALELTEILEPEILEKIGDNIENVYCDITKSDVAYGIKLTDEELELYNSSGESYENPVLFVIGNTTRVGTAVEFIEFLYRDK